MNYSKNNQPRNSWPLSLAPSAAPRSPIKPPAASGAASPFHQANSQASPGCSMVTPSMAARKVTPAPRCRSLSPRVATSTSCQAFSGILRHSQLLCWPHWHCRCAVAGDGDSGVVRDWAIYRRDIGDILAFLQSRSMEKVVHFISLLRGFNWLLK